MTTKEKLELFGEVFIKKVRDNTIFVLEGIISGHMKSQRDIILNEQIKKLSDEEIQLIRIIGYRMVDLSLHNTLFMFEENQDWIISNPSIDLPNLQDSSDGLTGELYTEDGWIEKYSQYSDSI